MMIRGYAIAGRTIALVVGAVLLVVFVLVFLSQCEKRRNEAAQARVDAAQGEAASNSAADAINAVSEAGRRETASEDLTRENERDIRAADGAGERINPAAHAAGLKALCRREAYKNTERCKIFREGRCDETARC